MEANFPDPETGLGRSNDSVSIHYILMELHALVWLMNVQTILNRRNQNKLGTAHPFECQLILPGLPRYPRCLLEWTGRENWEGERESVGGEGMLLEAVPHQENGQVL